MKQTTSVSLAVAAVFLLSGCGRTTVAVQQPQRLGLFEPQIQAEQPIGHLRWQVRTRVLDALTSSHRQLVAQLVGRLAVAGDPDVRAAVDELDRTLTLKEKVSILDGSRWLRQKTRPYAQKTTPNLLAADPFTRFLPQRMMHEDPGATLLVLTTNSIALRTSLAVRGASQP